MFSHFVNKKEVSIWSIYWVFVVFHSCDGNMQSNVQFNNVVESYFRLFIWWQKARLLWFVTRNAIQLLWHCFHAVVVDKRKTLFPISNHQHYVIEFNNRKIFIDSIVRRILCWTHDETIKTVANWKWTQL